MTPIATVFDIELDELGNPLVNEDVTIRLSRVAAASGFGNVTETTQRTVTDATGRWQFTVVPNGLMSPAGTFYVVVFSQRKTLAIAVPNVGTWQASTIPLIPGPGGGIVGAAPLTISVDGVVIGQVE